MTTLSKLQQEGREEFEGKFTLRNDCTGQPNEHIETCQGCIEIIIEEPDDVKAFLTTQIEKAYSAGEKSGYEQALSDVEKGLPKKVKVEWYEDSDYNKALSEVKEVIISLKETK